MVANVQPESAAGSNGELWRDLDAFPIRRPWADLRSAFTSHIRKSFAEWMTPDQSTFASQFGFALSRFDEGAGILRYLSLTEVNSAAGPHRVLDIGAGNGGVSVALANDQRFDVTAVDLVPNRDLLALRRKVEIPIRQIVGNGHNLPFADHSFRFVLLLDTIEHVPRADLLAAEIMRVLQPAGMCMITTPQRLEFFLRRDPHFGVPGLFLLPDPLQRFVVTRLMPRRVLSTTNEMVVWYDVEHIFWHVREIARLFPDPKNVDVLYDRTYSRRRPLLSREWIAFHLRDFFWGRVLVRKPANATS